MRIQPIVEGYGEVESVPVLLRRLVEASGAFQLVIKRPFRRNRTELVQESSLRDTVRIVLRQGCEGILILLDADDDCPKDLAPTIQAWVRDEAGSTPCEVVLANREYEAWLLASAVGFGASPVADVETVRDAKGKLKHLLNLDSYTPTADQPSLTARFDLAAANRSCRSFRRLVNAFRQVAAGAGSELTDWPPASWRP